MHCLRPAPSSCGMSPFGLARPVYGPLLLSQQCPYRSAANKSPHRVWEASSDPARQGHNRCLGTPVFARECMSDEVGCYCCGPNPGTLSRQHNSHVRVDGYLGRLGQAPTARGPYWSVILFPCGFHVDGHRTSSVVFLLEMLLNTNNPAAPRKERLASSISTSVRPIWVFVTRPIFQHWWQMVVMQIFIPKDTLSSNPITASEPARLRELTLSLSVAV